MKVAPSQPLSEDQSNQNEPERDQWNNKTEFLLSCIGLSCGLGNVWRFPYLAYQNGGAAFLLAYIILQLVIGKPQYLLELILGQYSGQGPTKCWELNPAARGIGISMCVMSLVVSIYYNVIMAYTIYFIFATMQSTLPWTKCKPEWTDCSPEGRVYAPVPCTSNVSHMESLGSCQCTKNVDIDTAFTFNCTPKYKTAPELYFYKDVIRISDGIEPEKMGTPIWELAMCLLLAWLLVALCLSEGIKTSGKVKSYAFTATFPYVVLVILLIRGSMLEGADTGVRFFIVPKWDQLMDINVWVAAAAQMFFSLGVSFGGIIMFASYNKFNNKLYGDSLLITCADFSTSIIAGFVVFTTFGHMAHTMGVPIEDVATSGYGLVFVAYPEAVSQLPVPHFWSFVFFVMLLTLGVDSQFAMLETVLTCIQDEFPWLRRWKTSVCVAVCVFCYISALPCVCPGGDYVVKLMDHYGADFSVLFLSLFEVISVMWVYAHRIINYEPPYIEKGKPFPTFAQALGWTLLIVIVSPVLLCANDLGRAENLRSNTQMAREENPDCMRQSLSLCPCMTSRRTSSRQTPAKAGNKEPCSGVEPERQKTSCQSL
ncbi:hypothetical protein C0Q70_03760 [Pomacea canaliculata]|uniref:Transporter n=1 Tax=Pomacea canaliculata TaxID=400727 RepID=A0A2T7PTR0_POMCA|nr:hypothetical protein C0Q70_03760 [Pomacea canaliculata]